MIGSLSIGVKIILIVVVFYYFEPDLTHLALIVFGSTFLGTVMMFISGIRNNRELSLKPSHFSLIKLRNLLSLAGSALIVTLSALIMTQSATLITGYVLGPDDVPLVAYPLLIFTALTPFMSAVQTILTPVASALAARKEKERILPIFQLAVRYQSAVAMFLLLVFIMFGELLIVKWLSGPRINTDSLKTIANSVIILLAGFSFSSIALIGRSVLTSVGKHWISAIIELATAFIGLVSGYLVMRYTALGVYGIAAGVTITLVIRGLLFYPYLIGKYFEIPPFKVITQGLGLNLKLTLISCFIPFGTFLAIDRQSLDDYITWFVFAKSTAIFIWCLLTWIFLVETKHKVMTYNKLSIYCAQLFGVLRNNIFNQHRP